MKKLLLSLLFVTAFILSSCKDDDNTVNPPATQNDPIVASWVCEGTNVPYGLKVAPFKVVKIEATFNSNKTYTVVQTDSSNVKTTLTGTYVTTESTSTDTVSTSLTKGAKILNIVCNQATPSAVVATGIFAINGTNMSYEVIQTTPPLSGVNPPTPVGGFGSTTIGGVKYPIYIQKFVKK